MSTGRKESAYKGLVHRVLEYGSSVWDPQSILLQDELEKVKKRAARFVTVTPMKLRISLAFVNNLSGNP